MIKRNRSIIFLKLKWLKYRREHGNKEKDLLLLLSLLLLLLLLNTIYIEQNDQFAQRNWNLDFIEMVPINNANTNLSIFTKPPQTNTKTKNKQ